MSKTKAHPSKSKRKPKMVTKTKNRSRVGLLWSAIVGIVGFAAAVVVFLPRPMVSPPSVPFDSNNRFSVSFDISNNGYIPIEDCTVLLGIGQIQFNNFTQYDPLSIPTFATRIVISDWQNHRLNMDDRITLTPADIFKGDVKYADIAIIVSYKPWFLPFRREKMFRFVTLKQADNLTYWRSWPVGEPLPLNK